MIAIYDNNLCILITKSTLKYTPNNNIYIDKQIKSDKFLCWYRITKQINKTTQSIDASQI